MEEILIQLDVIPKIELKFEEWYSKNFLLNKLKTGLNSNQKQHLIKILNRSKFDKLLVYSIVCFIQSLKYFLTGQGKLSNNKVCS